MAIYYKFKSAKEYDSIAIDGHFITVANLKERIFVKKHMEKGCDFDLIVTNAQTNQEYLDQDMLIPKYTSVIIRRVPGPPLKPIVRLPDKPKVETLVQDDQPAKSNLTAADSSGFFDFKASELFDEFESSLCATTIPGQVRNPVQDPVPSIKADEDNKIKALVENSGFNTQYHHNGFGQGRCGRGERDFGRGSLGFRIPPQNYVCHRCNVPGHFIQHCPTNGDPDYDIKKVRPPAVSVLKAHEDSFDKEMETLSSSHSRGDIPPELHCPLCKEVMKNAVLSSKCCFESFCDKCIRDYIISKSMCVCGVRDVLADDLLPNNTLRDTINRILDTGNSSADNTGGSVHQGQDMESAAYPHPQPQPQPQPKNSLSNQLAASEGDQMSTPNAKETPKFKEKVDGSEVIDASPQLVLAPSWDEKTAKVPDVFEATDVSVTLEGNALHSCAQPAVGEVQQKVSVVETGKKKFRKKVPTNVNDMQWTGYHRDMNGYVDHSACSPCWPGDGLIGPFDSNMPYYNMGYGIGPLNMPFSHSIPPISFGAPQFMIPTMLPPPQRDPAEGFGRRLNIRPQLMNKEEFNSSKSGVKGKQEMNSQIKRDPPEVHDYDKETNDHGRKASSSGNVAPVKSKLISAGRTPAHRSPSEGSYYNHHREHENDNKRRKNNRTSLGFDHSDTSYDPIYHRHRSHDHVSRDLDEPQPKRKSERHELERKRDEGRHHYGSGAYSQRWQPSEVAAAVLDKKHRSSRMSVSSEDYRKKRRD